MKTKRIGRLVGVGIGLGVLAACGSDSTAVTSPATTSAPDDSTAVTSPARPSDALRAERLDLEILRSVPHDATAFTQGLEFHDGALFESTGQYGDSTLREVDLETGSVQRRTAVPDELFAEGITIFDGTVTQLTWKAGRALVYRVDSFEPVQEFAYDGDGWGLCNFDGAIVMSDGTSTLTHRNEATFDVERTVEVRLDGTLMTDLNELECVGDSVWANVWRTDTILRIDPATGSVTGVVDARGLLSEDEAATADVLNGIAYNPDTDTFWITGKYWPKMFEVRFG